MGHEQRGKLAEQNLSTEERPRWLPHVAANGKCSFAPRKSVVAFYQPLTDSGPHAFSTDSLIHCSVRKNANRDVEYINLGQKYLLLIPYTFSLLIIRFILRSQFRCLQSASLIGIEEIKGHCKVKDSFGKPFIQWHHTLLGL